MSDFSKMPNVLVDIYLINRKTELIEYLRYNDFNYVQIRSYLVNGKVHRNHFSNLSDEQFEVFREDIRSKLSFINTLPFFNVKCSDRALVELDKYMKNIKLLNGFLNSDSITYDEYLKIETNFRSGFGKKIQDFDPKMYNLYLEKVAFFKNKFHTDSLEIATKIGRGIVIRNGKAAKIDSIDVLNFCSEKGMSVGKVYRELMGVSHDSINRNYLITAMRTFRDILSVSVINDVFNDYEEIARRLLFVKYNKLENFSTFEIEKADKYLSDNGIERRLTYIRDTIIRNREDKEKVVIKK